MRKPSQHNPNLGNIENNKTQQKEETISSDQMKDVYATLREEAEFTELIRKQNGADWEDVSPKNPQPIEVVKKPTSRSYGIEVIFMISLILAILGGIYSYKDEVISVFPQSEGVVYSYVEFVNNAKSTLFGQ